MSGMEAGPGAPALAHMAYLCPGLHEKGARQDIRRATFRQASNLI